MYFSTTGLPFVTAAVAEPAKTAVFDSGFLITVAIIIFSTLLIAFISYLKKDKCLKNFKGDNITVFFNDGRVIKGRMDVENTGSEIIYTETSEGLKKSHIIYKEEYDLVHMFVRFHGEMDKRRRREFEKTLSRTYHPNLFRKIGRSILIFFKIIRDSFMDIFTVLSGKIKTANPDYAKNEAYISKVNKEAVGSVDTTYNPLLEKYIGNRVVCTHLFNGKPYECKGILKDYTASYIELLDVSCSVGDNDINDADMVISRTTTKVRHLAEDLTGLSSLNREFKIRRYKKEIKKSNHGNLGKGGKTNDNGQ